MRRKPRGFERFQGMKGEGPMSAQPITPPTMAATKIVAMDQDELVRGKPEDLTGRCRNWGRRSSTPFSSCFTTLP
jgi:hypothetical protein